MAKKSSVIKKACPFCRGEIHRETMVCQNCGTGFPMEPENHRNERGVNKENDGSDSPWLANSTRHMEEK